MCGFRAWQSISQSDGFAPGAGLRTIPICRLALDAIRRSLNDLLALHDPPPPSSLSCVLHLGRMEKEMSLTWADIEAAAKKGYGCGPAPRIKTLADFINKNMPGFTANLTKTSDTPYRKPRGCRYITHTGNTKHGWKLEVYIRRDSFPVGIVRPVFTHSAVETYRRNSEVCVWIMENKPK